MVPLSLLEKMTGPRLSRLIALETRAFYFNFKKVQDLEETRMMDATKYAPGYYPVPAGYDSWVKKDHIEKRCV